METLILDAFRYWRRLRKPAGQALQLARKDFWQGTRRYPGGPVYAWNRPADDGSIWIESATEAGLRFVNFSDKICGHISHTGWYTSENGDNGESLRGAVLQLPAKAGRVRFMAGYADPNNDGAYRLDGAIYEAAPDDDNGDAWNNDPGDRDAALEAARAADSFAEKTAESERDYNAAWRLGNEWADKRTEAREARAAGRHAEARELFAEARKILSDNCYLYQQADAFNDGAGERHFPAWPAKRKGN